MNRPPRKPNRRQTHKLEAWIRYYERMAQWNREAAAHLDEYPNSKKFCIETARGFEQGVTDILIGAHPMQITGQWS